MGRQDIVPVVEVGWRRFLEELRVADEERYTLFLQPRPDLPRIDLLALLAPSNPGSGEEHRSSVPVRERTT